MCAVTGALWDIIPLLASLLLYRSRRRAVQQHHITKAGLLQLHRLQQLAPDGRAIGKGPAWHTRVWAGSCWGVLSHPETALQRTLQVLTDWQLLWRCRRHPSLGRGKTTPNTWPAAVHANPSRHGWPRGLPVKSASLDDPALQPARSWPPRSGGAGA